MPTIISDSTVNGRRTVVFDESDFVGTERFTAVLRRKGISGGGNFTVWVDVSHAIGNIYSNEDFQFPRDSDTGTRIVTDGNGDPLMDNDEVAPQYTLQTATQKLLAESARLRWMQRQTTLSNDAELTQEMLALRNELTEPLIGQHYLPDGRTWKTESIPTLTALDVLDTVARNSLRKYRRMQIAGLLNGSIDPIGGE